MQLLTLLLDLSERLQKPFLLRLHLLVNLVLERYLLL